MKQLAFHIDASACSGCKTCQVACKDKHNSPLGVRWRRVYEVCGGGWIKKGAAWVQNLQAYHLSMACNHCQDPICMHACPNKAIRKNQHGLVLINYDRCMGCRYCEWTCPYGALQFDPEQKIMTKCSFCADYLDEGKPPSCVSACPMRVLNYGELDELEKQYGKNRYDFPLPEPHHTKPALIITSHKDAEKSKGNKMTIANTEEVRS